MADVDEYEQERLANIRKNQELLKDLNLIGHTKSAGREQNGGSSKKPKPKQPQKRKPSKPAVPERVQPRRTSNRIAGLEADSEVIKRKAEEEYEQQRLEREAAKKARHQDYDLSTLLGLEKDDIEGRRELELALRGISSKQPSLNVDLLQDIQEVKRRAKNEHASKEHKELTDVFDKMQLQSVDKVVKARIYSMIVHPSVDKDLVFAGDKAGSIGVWDPLAKVEVDEEDEDVMPSGHSWSLQAHGTSPITCLRFDPITADSLFSSSYDSTIRMQSLESGISKEVWSGDESVLISIFDILAPQSHPSAFLATPSHGLDERSMWIADHRGGLCHFDIRAGQKKQETQRWQVCEKKIGGMSVNPMQSSCISVASLDRQVRLFDVRNLQVLKTTNDAPLNATYVDDEVLEIAVSKAQIAQHGAKQACTSVDWDPTGRKLVGVSYDDMVKVWDVDPSSLRTVEGPPTSNGGKSGRKSGVKKEESDAPLLSDVLEKPIEIRHNNQTGKWLTLFRARFNANPTVEPHFTIGSMDRRAEIWSADGTLLRSFYDEDHVTAVPAVTCTHPRRVGRLATGNASGKCTFWAPSD